MKPNLYLLDNILRPRYSRSLWLGKIGRVCCLLVLLHPLGTFAATSVAELDRDLAGAVTARSSDSAESIVKRYQPKPPPEALSEAVSGRETLAAGLDAVRNAAKGEKLQVAQASILVDILFLLDSLGRVDSQHGIANAIPALKHAIWQRYVTPALADARRTEPLNPPLPGRLAGQWADGQKTSVRILDLWADQSNEALAWSMTAFASPMSNAERIISRDTANAPHNPAAKLALYIDLGSLSRGDIEDARQAQSREGGGLSYILDDTASRTAQCVEDAKARQAHADPSPAQTQTAKEGAGNANLSEKSQSVADSGTTDTQELEVRCQHKTASEELAGKAILFDPSRRIRVLDWELSKGVTPFSRILSRAAAFGKIWP